MACPATLNGIFELGILLFPLVVEDGFNLLVAVFANSK
jgi:hypothetical protein